MIKIFVAIAVLSVLGFSLFKQSIYETYWRYTERIQVETPGGCLEIAIDQDTRFNDLSGDTDRGFSINCSPGYGPLKWSFISRSGDTSDDEYVFQVRTLLNENAPISGQGCFVLNGSGNLKQVAREMKGQPEASYDECTMFQHRNDPTYMLFDEKNEAVAVVQCGRTPRTYCSGNIEIGDAIFRLGMLQNDISELEVIRNRVPDIFQENMTVKKGCSSW